MINSSKYLESIGISIYDEEVSLEKLMMQSPYEDKVETLMNQSIMSNSSAFMKQSYQKRLYNYICIVHTAINLKYPNVNYYSLLKRAINVVDFLVKF